MSARIVLSCSSTTSWAVARRCGVFGLSYFLVTFASLRILDLCNGWLLESRGWPPGSHVRAHFGPRLTSAESWVLDPGRPVDPRLLTLRIDIPAASSEPFGYMTSSLTEFTGRATASRVYEDDRVLVSCA